MNGYLEAEKIDQIIMEVYRNKPDTKHLHLHNQHEKNMAWKREMLKYLRTIETACTLLQKGLTG